MVSRLATITTLAGVLLAAPIASAFTLGETTATMGVQGTLARSGTSKPAGTIGTVKRSLNAAVAGKQAQLEATGLQVGWGGKGGGQSGWTAAGSGWAGNGGSAGWTTASTNWASGANGGGAWATGGWK